MNQELQKYIQDGLKAGTKPEDIRKALVDAGWDAKQVGAALQGTRHDPKRGRVAVVVVGSLLTAGGVAAAIFFAVTAAKKSVPPATLNPVALASPALPSTENEKIAQCKTMESAAEADDCYWEVASSNNDENICERIDSQNTKYACFKGIAAAKKDQKICERIPPPVDKFYSTRESCILYIMEITDNPTDCDQLYTTQARDDCFLMAAKKNQDLSLCRMMSDLDRMFVNCYGLFNNQLRSIDDCAPLVNDWIFHDECLGIVARNTGDISICDGLDNGNASDYRKETCRGIAVPVKINAPNGRE